MRYYKTKNKIVDLHTNLKYYIKDKWAKHSNLKSNNQKRLLGWLKNHGHSPAIYKTKTLNAKRKLDWK